MTNKIISREEFMGRIWTAIVAMLVAVGGSAASVQAQTSTTMPPPLYIQFNRAMGALYQPADGTTAHIGVVVMHREANFMSNIACREFSKRGLMVLCMNSRFVNNETNVSWEQIPLDVAQGVKYLKDVQHMDKVVLYGNSGGGVTMSFYQAVAENGPSVCQGPGKLIQCGNDLTGLPKADAIILSDGHPGNPILRLRSINPSIIGDRDHPQIDPALDPYSPANGYNPNGSSHYSDDFKAKYFAAQSARMNKLIDEAQQIYAGIQAGKNFYTDDAPFPIPGFDDARLQSMDTSIRHTTAQPEKLLKNDGSIVTEMVPSIYPPRLELAKLGRTFRQGARDGLTVHSFLSSNAIRSTNSLDEKKIDLCSSNNSTPCMLQHVTVPLLAVAQQASFQNLIAEIESNHLYATTKDKDFIVIEGATTGSTPCTVCGQPASAYSNATKNFYDYATKWIHTRFG
jgi:hypothetical protein